MKKDKIYNKPLKKNELTKIKKSFEKLGLRTDSYIEYLSKENTIPIGKGKHHIYPVSLFNNNKIYRTTIKWHTRLHLLLVADNLERILNNDFDINLLKLTMGACVRYAFGYRKLKNNNTYTYKKSWFFKNDLEFFKKYFNTIDHNIRSFYQKELWKNEDYRNNQIDSFNEFWSSELGSKAKDNLSEIQKELWKNEDYRNNQIDKKKELWKDEDYRSNQSLAKQELWSNPEWLEYWSEIDSKFMKELWKNEDYRKYMLRCREESGAYEKISKSKKNEWNHLTTEEYQKRCENISKGINSVDKSNLGSKTKSLWENEDYKQHMKLVHSKEYRIEHGTYKEMSEESKKKQASGMKLVNFKRSQQAIIEKLFTIDSIDDLTRDYYSKLYSHKYLFTLCNLKYKFTKSRLIEKWIKDFSDIKIDYYSNIPKSKLKKQLIRLINA